jgi:long-chain acyl-CoA synthetase
MSKKPWVKNYDEGVPEHIEYPDIPCHSLLEKSAERFSDKTITIFKGAEITYKEMNDISDRLAAGLHSIGIKKGDRVGLFMPNTPQFVMAYYALMKIGAIVVATNPLYTEREIIHQVNDAGVEVMILMTNNYEKIKAIQAQTKIQQIIATNIKETLPPLLRVLFTLMREKKGGFRVKLRDNDIWMQDLIDQFNPEDRPKVDVSALDTALFQYSGGTTGISKGVIAPHKAVVANTYQMVSWATRNVEGEEVMCLAIPLYHVYGMVAGLNYGVLIGASMVMVPDPRDMPDVLDNLTKHNVTIYPGVPAMYNAINVNPDVIAGKHDLSSLKICISGSAPLLRETREHFEELTGGKLVEGYGLSEAPTASHCNPFYGENRAGSISLPLPDVDCKIVDVDDGTKESLPGEVGEIIIKAPQVMDGYHNMPTETENALRNGWLHTGDIAYMDEDGYFYIVDRKKEMIKPGGFQVWPREVEEVLQAYPSVLEVCAGGIPDPISGEAVKAWIVLKPGETATAEEIIEWAKKDLAKYKVPKEIEFRNELPKTTVGKILRRELIKQHKEKS